MLLKLSTVTTTIAANLPITNGHRIAEDLNYGEKNNNNMNWQT